VIYEEVCWERFALEKIERLISNIFPSHEVDEPLSIRREIFGINSKAISRNTCKPDTISFGDIE